MKQKPTSMSKKLERKKLFENAKRKSETLNKTLQKAIILFTPRIFFLPAKRIPPRTAPIPEVATKSPSPFGPACKISSLKIGMSELNDIPQKLYVPMSKRSALIGLFFQANKIPSLKYAKPDVNSFITCSCSFTKNKKRIIGM